VARDRRAPEEDLVIDFRYHVVSLISVFLALAVGIVLGAGPLKEAIGDTLTGEVDQLRTAAAHLRTELDQTGTALDQSDEAFAAIAPDLLAGTLESRSVSIIEIGDTGDGVVQDITDRIVQTGATVNATVHVTGEWTDPARATYRRALSGTLIEYLDPAPDVDAGTSEELSEALIQALTARDPENPAARTENATVLLDLLVEGGLVEVVDPVTAPADAVVVLVGPDGDTPEDDPDAEASPEPTDDEVAARQSVEDAVVDIALAAHRRSGGVVVGAYALAGDGVLQRLRGDDSTRRAVSTVAYIQSVVGGVSVPLALAQNMDGAAGHYGPDDNATAVVPPRVVILPEPDVTTPTNGIVPPDPATATDGSTAPADGTQTGTQG
jgi:hypothetical protein